MATLAPVTFSLTNTPGAPASIAPTAGTPQSAAVGTAFNTPLQALVTDSFGNPLSGVPVSFVVPVGGATVNFGGPATVTTNSSGIATAPAFTANSIAGSYTIGATVPSIATPANFALTNTPGLPASIMATAGTPQSASFNTQFEVPLEATVTDSFGNGVSGVSVLFVAPPNGASGTFSASSTVTTDASGIAIAPAFTANAIGGSYTVTATATGLTPASFALSNLLSPTITSANTVSFIVGTGGTFMVQTTGFPVPAITFAAELSGVTFNDNGDGTATLLVSSGSTLSAGLYPIQITASNGVNPDFVQNFTLALTQNPPVVPPLNSDDNPGLINTPVHYTFTATDAVVPTLSYTFNFGDGSPSLTGTFPQGTPVTVMHTYTNYTDGVTVSLTVSDGAQQVTVTTLQTIPMPSSTGSGFINIALNQPPIVAPLDGIAVDVASSIGGVVQLGIDIDSLTRAAYTVSTDWGDVAGRSQTVTGTHPVHSFINRGIFVATTTATNADTNVEAGKARITLALSSKETGDFPSHGTGIQPQPQLHARDAGGVLPNDLPSIATKNIKGKFDFTGKTPDLVSFQGTIILPPGLDLRSDYEFWIAIGNIVVKTTIHKGKGTDFSVPGIIKSLKISTRAKIKYITVGGEIATINVTYSAKNTVNMGFDTEGISNKSTDVSAGKSAPRKIQVAMLIDGAPFQTVTPVDFSTQKGGDFGSMSGRNGN